jgi:adenosylcobinamide kinase/adenosylcobinamide-phosphate guanylyltransferase
MRDDPALTLILGGVRSGKSAYAEALASRLGRRVFYIATAEALDDEMRGRVATHQARRPPDWRTLEVSLHVGATLQAMLDVMEADVLLLDCLTMLVSNVILSTGVDGTQRQVDEAWAAVHAEVEALLAAHDLLGMPLIVVSNEVGLGVVPSYALGRIYRDCLGWANQALARVADRVIYMVAGLPVDVKALPSPLIDKST